MSNYDLTKLINEVNKQSQLIDVLTRTVRTLAEQVELNTKTQIEVALAVADMALTKAETIIEEDQ